MLVLRDCFFGVRRFTDLQAHLDVPRAVLTDRLTRLVDEGMLTRTEYQRGRHEYPLTERGRDLWPALFALSSGASSTAPRDGRAPDLQPRHRAGRTWHRPASVPPAANCPRRRRSTSARVPA